MGAPAVVEGKHGRERLGRAAVIARHRHAAAYIAVVLSGSYEEAGNAGRFVARAGDVILHSMFDCHLNRVGRAGADVLNLPFEGLSEHTIGRIADADSIARCAEADSESAVQMVAAQWQSVASTPADWADALHAALQSDTSLRLQDWARREGLAPETLSRAFRKLYGVTPAGFRVEARARAAWRRIVTEDTPLATVASECGFADQAHMTRCVRALSNATPQALRRAAAFGKSNSFKTAMRVTA
jgi:AraC-like DNA-binding protein